MAAIDTGQVAPRKEARRGSRVGSVAGIGYVTLIYVFFYLPIFVIILFAFNDKQIPALPIEGLTLGWFEEALADEPLMESLWLSTWVALVTAVLAIAIGMPAAMVLAWRPFKGKAVVFGLILSPIIRSSSERGNLQDHRQMEELQLDGLQFPVHLPSQPQRVISPIQLLKPVRLPKQKVRRSGKYDHRMQALRLQ